MRTGLLCLGCLSCVGGEQGATSFNSFKGAAQLGRGPGRSASALAPPVAVVPGVLTFGLVSPWRTSLGGGDVVALRRGRCAVGLWPRLWFRSGAPKGFHRPGSFGE